MADMNDAALTALFNLHADFIRVIEAAMKAEQDMHAASLQAQQGLLTTALKGAENVSPEAFATLIGALERVTVAGIEAEREVALAHAENGRAAVKMLDNALQGAIQVGGQVATARLAQLDRKVRAEEKRADAKATAAAAEAMKAEKLKSVKLKSV